MSISPKEPASLRYTFQLSGDLLLDCGECGNEWRHVNHSCTPNAELVCWSVTDEPRLGVFLLRAVASGEEITVDYRRGARGDRGSAGQLVLKHDIRCACRSPNCTTTIGPTAMFASRTHLLVPRCCIDNGVCDETAMADNCRDRNTDSVATVAMAVDTQSVAASTATAAATDRLACHRCDGHGELIACHKAGCRRRYHLHCVELTGAPGGLWLCPKHFCALCGQAASAFCRHCSTSHCKTHGKLQKQHSCRRVKEEAAAVETVAVTPVVKREEDVDDEKDEKPMDDVVVVVSKRDLYSSCGLVPILESIANDSRLMSSVAGDNSPNQVNLTIKRQLTNDTAVLDDNTSSGDRGPQQRASKQPRLSRADSDARRDRRSVCNISNYLSTDEEFELVADPMVEEAGPDCRCQVVPLGIEEMENFIVSPMLLDD